MLGAYFPTDRERLAAMSEQVGLSRRYGGIHHWFDIEGGSDLRRTVADAAPAFDQQHDLLSLLP